MITANAADFAAALPDGGRLAGLDAGTKTIGLATCDAGWSFAELCEQLAEQGELAPTKAASWLKQWISDGLLQRRV